MIVVFCDVELLIVRLHRIHEIWTGCAETAEWIDVLFGDPRNIALDGVPH